MPPPEEEEEPDPPRNFTATQLRKFDGTEDENSGEPKPVYLSLNGTVFDVSNGRDFYGPGGAYEMFAGRECGVALAKMSFEEEHLDNVAGCADLNPGEKCTLDDWMEKFQHFKGYPILGKLVPDDLLPSPDRILKKSDLEKHNGIGEIPEGYASQPIYVGVGGSVFDVSFGGVIMYAEGASYHRFAGKNVSRALAKMSFDPADIESTDLSDLTEKQRQVLNDWKETFTVKKLYPTVGKAE